MNALQQNAATMNKPLVTRDSIERLGPLGWLEQKLGLERYTPPTKIGLTDRFRGIFGRFFNSKKTEK